MMLGVIAPHLLRDDPHRRAGRVRHGARRSARGSCSSRAWSPRSSCGASTTRWIRFRCSPSRCSSCSACSPTGRACCRSSSSGCRCSSAGCAAAWPTSTSSQRCCSRASAAPRCPTSRVSAASLIQLMTRAGYPLTYSAALTAATSIIGPIIPPSVAMIIYALADGQRVGRRDVRRRRDPGRSVRHRLSGRWRGSRTRAGQYGVTLSTAAAAQLRCARRCAWCRCWCCP